jgi:hypothetical protein
MNIDPDKIEHVVMIDEIDHGSNEPFQNSPSMTSSPPPSFNPEFINRVASDIPSENTSIRSFDTTSTSPPTTRSFDSNTTSSSSSSSFQPEPTYHRSSSWKDAVAKVKKMTGDGARKVQQYDQDHQVRIRAKRAAIQSCFAVKKVTIQAGHKTKEFNDKYQLVTAKTKHQLKRSAAYVSRRSCSVYNRQKSLLPMNPQRQ